MGTHNEQRRRGISARQKGRTIEEDTCIKTWAKRERLQAFARRHESKGEVNRTNYRDESQNLQVCIKTTWREEEKDNLFLNGFNCLK